MYMGNELGENSRWAVSVEGSTCCVTTVFRRIQTLLVPDRKLSDPPVRTTGTIKKSSVGT